MTQNTSFSLIHGSRVFDRRDVMLQKWDSASCLGMNPAERSIRVFLMTCSQKTCCSRVQRHGFVPHSSILPQTGSSGPASPPGCQRRYPGILDMRTPGQLRHVSRADLWPLKPQRLSEQVLALNTLDPSLSDYSPPTEVESSGAICKPRPLATRVP